VVVLVLICPGLALGTYESFSFIYSYGNFSGIILPEAYGKSSPRYAINDNGEIIGALGEGKEYFVLSSGHVTTASIPGAKGVRASGINKAGSVVGMYFSATGEELGFLAASGTIKTIRISSCHSVNPVGINNKGQIAGFCGSGLKHSPQERPSLGFILDVDGSLDIFGAPTGVDIFPTGIDNDGRVVGTFYAGNGVQSFLYSHGAWKVLNNSACGSLEARGISNNGRIVGHCAKPGGDAGDLVGFELDTASSAFRTFAPPGANATFPDGVNDKGQIVGTWHHF
jgi:uncharacterized membrane protein